MFGPLFQFDERTNSRCFIFAQGSGRIFFPRWALSLIEIVSLFHLSRSHPNHIRNLCPMIRRDNWLISTTFLEKKLVCREGEGMHFVPMAISALILLHILAFLMLRMVIAEQFRAHRQFATVCVIGSNRIASLCVFISSVSAINEHIYRRTMVRIRQKLAEIHLRSNKETTKCAKQCSRKTKRSKKHRFPVTNTINSSFDREHVTIT